MNKNSIKNNSQLHSKSIMGYTIAITIMTLVMSIFSVYSVLIVAFGILPGLIAVVVDREFDRYSSKIVLMFNCIGMAPFIIKIIRNASSKSIVTDVIIDPNTWLIIYGATCIGWIIYWFFPLAAVTISNARNSVKIKQLENEISLLVKEWGEEVIPKNKILNLKP